MRATTQLKELKTSYVYLPSVIGWNSVQNPPLAVGLITHITLIPKENIQPILPRLLLNCMLIPSAISIFLF